MGRSCVIDRQPRDLDTAQIEMLRNAAKLVASHLQLLKSAFEAKTFQQQLDLVMRSNTIAATAIEAMSEGVVVQNKTGAIIQANSSASKILGLSMDQLLGRVSIDPSWGAVTEAGDPFPGEMHPAMVTLRTGKSLDDIIMGLDQDQRERRWIKINSRPLFEGPDKEPSHVVATFTDITHSKNQEAELKRLSLAATQASQTKTVFLANMSHEIRTPLNGVVGIAGALARTSLDEQQREMVDLINNSGMVLDRLLNDILDLSKVESGQLELEIKPFNLRETVESVANLLRFKAEEKGLVFTVDVSKDVNETYIGDGLRIRQIISNLTMNALKFTDEGEVNIHVAKMTEKGIEIVISDTGIGIEPEVQKQLFKRFAQADSSITRRYGGSGLGLSISKSLAELMGGKIELNSQPHRGSKIIVNLPLEEAEQNLVDGSLAEISCRNVPTTLKVLLVEDNLMNQKVFSIMMHSLGLSHDTVGNGKEAIDISKAQKFDIIFMDMQMPVMDGLKATRAIRAMEIESSQVPTPIVMLTANASEEHRNKASAAGADYHLVKPLNFQALLAAFQSLVDDRA